MLIWIDLANSPHVPLFAPVVEHFGELGWEVVLTARDHAQTVDLARRRWPEVLVLGGGSPPHRVAKARAVTTRAHALRRIARRARPDVALSHGSYAQVLAARSTGVPVVTMMDYEYQPANHASFRLASRVVVPEAFPVADIRRFGARRKTLRYAGYKEELYLAGFVPDPTVLAELGLDPHAVIVVMRPPPSGALYHQHENPRFDELLRLATSQPGVQTVVLPRTTEQAAYARAVGAVVPERAVDGASLVASADLVIGAGGTMNREAALLGAPTYTIFGGRIAAVDESLIRAGRLHDLRDGPPPPFEKTPRRAGPRVAVNRRKAILAVVEEAVRETAGVRERRRRQLPVPRRA